MSLKCGRKIVVALVTLTCSIGLGFEPIYAQWPPSMTQPIPVNSMAESDSQTLGNDGGQQVISDGKGNWIVVWSTNYHYSGGPYLIDYDLFLSRSNDNGETWSAAAPLNTNATTDNYVDNDGSPSIATDRKGTWIAVWNSTEATLGEVIGADQDILWARSVDNGISWTDPGFLNTTATTDGETVDKAPCIATDGLGNWLVAWESFDPSIWNGDDSNILVAHSNDNGATWSDPTTVSIDMPAPSDEVDLEANLVTDGKGLWLLVWESTNDLNGTIGQDIDILYAKSTDNGATWTTPAAIHSTAATDISDDFGPRAATDGWGHWVIVWEALRGVYNADHLQEIGVISSADNAATWSNPLAMAKLPDTRHASRHRRPFISTDGIGKWVLVWQSDDDINGTMGNDYDAFVSQSEDNGASWSPIMPFNSFASSDGDADDQDLRLATDGRGQWVAVWRSEFDFGGTIGPDYDLFSTSFRFGGPIPAVSTIGLVVTAVLLMTAASVLIRKRRFATGT